LIAVSYTFCLVNIRSYLKSFFLGCGPNSYCSPTNEMSCSIVRKLTILAVLCRIAVSPSIVRVRLSVDYPAHAPMSQVA